LKDKQYIQVNQALFSLAHSYELRQQQDERARDAGLRLSDCAVLMVLGQTQSITASGLADRMAINRGTISLYVQRLVEKGFIQRERDQKNRRFWWLALTDIGTEAYRAILEGTVQHSKDILSVLNAAEQRTLHQLLLKAAHGLGFVWQ